MSFIAERLAKYNVLKAKYAQEAVVEKPVTIKLLDGKTFPAQTTQTFLEIAKIIVKASKVYSKFVAVKVNDVVMDLSMKPTADCSVQFLTFDDELGKEVFWHSSAHVLGAVLEQMYAGHLGHGPALDSGFFYDCFIEGGKVIDQEQLDIITTEMKKFATQKEAFERLMVSKAEALDLFSYSKLKVELIQDHVKEGELCSLYKSAGFVDFCRGPHVPELPMLKSFQALSCSAAYFKGDQTRESMQRVYAIAFPSEGELKAYNELIEEAKRRDHRTISTQMDLFIIHKFAPGMPLFAHNGTIIFRRLEGFIRSLLHKYHYIEVMTPNFLNTELWQISGHLEHYKENMFLLNQKEPTDPLFGLKPMNCPAHCLIFKHSHHSKQDMPVRMSEFGVVHRNEVSGALSGLTRVVRFEQDDAHIFCTVDQIHLEITNIIRFIEDAYRPFGLPFSFVLSLRPESRIGSDELWDKAETTLRSVLTASNYKFVECPGDGAFYGPKIDVKLTDALNRLHQCGTVQLDFNLPSEGRFNLTYADYDTELKKQIESHPVMIHRAVLGSLERFMAVMIEHVGGKFPFWISPRQVMVIPTKMEFDEYAHNVSEQFYQAGFECAPDLSGEKLARKIAMAFQQNYNVVMVVGKKELDEGGVTVQGRTLAAYDQIKVNPEKHQRFMKNEEALAWLKKLAEDRSNM